MSNTTSISDFIKQLKTELELSNQDDGSDLRLYSAEVRLNFQAKSDELDGHPEKTPKVNFQIPIGDSNLASHELRLSFSNKHISESRSHECDVTVKQNGQELKLSDENVNGNDFEGFKQRFEKNVELKHGQPPKKKNIFED